MDVRKLIKICEGKHVYIQTHNFPDPDAIASAYGLQKLFENFGIASTIIYVGKIDKLSTTKMVALRGPRESHSDMRFLFYARIRWLAQKTKVKCHKKPKRNTAKSKSIPFRLSASALSVAFLRSC